MSNKIVEYKDLIAFHPGQYVGELIEDYNVTQTQKDDYCLVAEVDSALVGAVWARIIDDYGHIDDDTPYDN